MLAERDTGVPPLPFGSVSLSLGYEPRTLTNLMRGQSADEGGNQLMRTLTNLVSSSRWRIALRIVGELACARTST